MARHHALAIFYVRMPYTARCRLIRGQPFEDLILGQRWLENFPVGNRGATKGKFPSRFLRNEGNAGSGLNVHSTFITAGARIGSRESIFFFRRDILSTIRGFSHLFGLRASAGQQDGSTAEAARVTAMLTDMQPNAEACVFSSVRYGWSYYDRYFYSPQTGS
jgi:hypothetical protein